MSSASNPLSAFADALHGFSSLQAGELTPHPSFLPVTTGDPSPSSPSGGSSSPVSFPSTVVNTLMGPTGGLFDFFGIEVSFSRIVAIVLGLLIIAGSLFLFGADELVKTVRESPIVRGAVES